MMKIKIDVRESELLKRCQAAIDSNTKFRDIQLLTEQLPLGDVIINDGTNDCIIIERKTFADLAASIKDGRYDEQSLRLNGLPHHNHNIIYLLEGDINRLNSFKSSIDKQTLYSAMFSINYFKGFSVMRTNNIDETAIILCNMVYKLVGGLKAGRTAYYSNTASEQPTESNDQHEDQSQTQQEDQIQQEKEYCSVVKKVKKDNITENNIGEIMLCQVPGISSATAIAILAQFKTLPALIKAIQEDETCLSGICTTDANGKSRKISKTVIASILKFLKA
jgi:ERCC4-type nuclease